MHWKRCWPQRFHQKVEKGASLLSYVWNCIFFFSYLLFIFLNLNFTFLNLVFRYLNLVFMFLDWEFSFLNVDLIFLNLGLKRCRWVQARSELPYKPDPTYTTQVPDTSSTMFRAPPGLIISGPSSIEPRMNLYLSTRARPGVYSRPLFLTCILALSFTVWSITDSKFYDSSFHFLVPLTWNHVDVTSHLSYISLHCCFHTTRSKTPDVCYETNSWPELSDLWFPASCEFPWPRLRCLPALIY